MNTDRIFKCLAITLTGMCLAGCLLCTYIGDPDTMEYGIMSFVGIATWTTISESGETDSRIEAINKKLDELKP